MSSVYGTTGVSDPGNDLYLASNCIDGRWQPTRESDVCSTSVNDSDPWLVIDYGDSRALDDLTMIRVSSFNRFDSVDRIAQARIAVTMEPTGVAVVWSSSFNSSKGMFAFRHTPDDGVALATKMKGNECRSLFEFCTNYKTLNRADTPSFQYFDESGVTPVTCDFALAKCYEDSGAYLQARLYYIKAGGSTAKEMDTGVETGSAAYLDRLAGAAAALGSLYTKFTEFFSGNHGIRYGAYPWYTRALSLGWKPPEGRCIWGHKRGSDTNGTFVAANGPASWNGMCHSTWDTCDPMNRAILSVALSTGRIYNERLLPAGSKCTAVCVGDELGDSDTAEIFARRSDFTCGNDGLWKGELLCPDADPPMASNDGSVTSKIAETSPRSTWRADSHPSLQPRWQLSAVKSVAKANSKSTVECEWVDTRAIRGRYLWVYFAPQDDTFITNLGGDFDIRHAPTVKAYTTTYTNMESIPEYAEMYVFNLPIRSLKRVHWCTPQFILRKPHQRKMFVEALVSFFYSAVDHKHLGRK
jgi:hypothetical protein